MQEYDLSKLQIGDIFNFIPLSLDGSKGIIDLLGRFVAQFIAVVTFSRYNHTAQVTGITTSEDGEVTIQITEALPKLGVYTKDFNPKWLPNITIYRVHCFDEDSEAAAAFWRSLSGSKYDLPAAALSGARTLLNFFRGEKLLFDMPKKYFCSNGVALGFASVRIKIADCNPSQCTPGDINRSGEYADTISIARSL